MKNRGVLKHPPGNNYLHGVTVTFTCKPDYFLHGDQQRTCVNGSWSPGWWVWCRERSEEYALKWMTGILSTVAIVLAICMIFGMFIIHGRQRQREFIARKYPETLVFEPERSMVVSTVLPVQPLQNTAILREQELQGKQLLFDAKNLYTIFMLFYLTQKSLLFGLICLISLLCLPTHAIDFDFTRYHDYPNLKLLFSKLIKDQLSKNQIQKPVFGLMAGITHENGLLFISLFILPTRTATEMCVKIIWFNLLTGYGTDETITNYVNQLNFYIFPVLNPDGFIFSRTSKSDLVRQWRKNRAPANCSGFTTYKKTDEFQGPIAFSEPESRAVRDFVYHQKSMEMCMRWFPCIPWPAIFLPFNYHRKTYPKDYADLEKLAYKAVNAIRSVHDTEYRVGTAADLLGPATGGATDWIKQNTQIKYVMVCFPNERSLAIAHSSRNLERNTCNQ
uniref:Sushi domain-containing protein n=1 Tax=Ditylenchus dipsaci TaxID=166011 RepID=A0A915D8F4_9BILA